MAQHVAAQSTPDLAAVDGDAAGDGGEVEAMPIDQRISQDRARVEEIVGDQAGGADLAEIDEALVDDLNRRHDRPHRAAGAVPVERRRRGRKRLAQLHGNLALQAQAMIVAVAQPGRAFRDGRGEDAAGARMIDADELLHHRRGAADLVADQGAEARFQAVVQHILDLVSLRQVARTRFGRQRPQPVRAAAAAGKDLRRAVPRRRVHGVDPAGTRPRGQAGDYRGQARGAAL